MSSDYDKDVALELVKNIRELDYLSDVTLISGLDMRRYEYSVICFPFH